MPAFNRAYLAYWEEQWARQRAPAWALAHACAREGDRERALKFLQRALAEHDSQMVFLKVRPEFDFLAADPRFQALVARVGIPGA